MATLTARWLNSASQYALALAVWEACFDLAAFVCARGYAETAFAARVAGLPAERLTAHDALADELLGALSRDASVARLDYFYLGQRLHFLCCHRFRPSQRKMSC